MEMFLGKNNIHSYYQFSRKTLEQKNIIEKINLKINELKQYYLKCKHKKYLENVKYLISSTTGLTHIANEIQHYLFGLGYKEGSWL
jgi:predicted adenine nucleotide alpha hydrolase (AANH) superfamily ATPase